MGVTALGTLAGPIWPEFPHTQPLREKRPLILLCSLQHELGESKCPPPRAFLGHPACKGDILACSQTVISLPFGNLYGEVTQDPRSTKLRPPNLCLPFLSPP